MVAPTSEGVLNGKRRSSPDYRLVAAFSLFPLGSVDGSKVLIHSMAIRVLESTSRGYKIRKIFAKESTHSLISIKQNYNFGMLAMI